MKPNIIVTTVDIERLESLIDSMRPMSDTTVELLEELQRAEVVEPHAIPCNVVTMNSTVRFTIGLGKEEFHRRLVYPREVMDSSTISVLSPVGSAEVMDSSTISVLSPVGSALLGLAVGSSIEWLGPTGERLVVRIVEVVRQPESVAASQQ